MSSPSCGSDRTCEGQPDDQPTRTQPRRHSLTVSHPDGHPQAWWSQDRRLAGRRTSHGRRHGRGSTTRCCEPSSRHSTGSTSWTRASFATISELAEAEKLDRSFVSHVLRLTLLAPDLVEAILDGQQPRTMQLQPLMRGFPVERERQRRNGCWS